MTYLKQLLPLLGGAETKYSLFYEIKANLSCQDIKALRNAGIDTVQPGIESFSSRVLGLMKKGSDCLQNINILRWCRFYGVTVYWNLLWGFPGENLDDYIEQAELLKMLVHLPPPMRGGRIWLERFSPLFERKEEFGLYDVKPEKSYGYIYPASIDITNIAYFFEFQVEGALPQEAFKPLEVCISEWQLRWSDSIKPSLTFSQSSDGLVIRDSRSSYATEEHIDPARSLLYMSCIDRPRSFANLRTMFGSRCCDDEIREGLTSFCSRGYMASDGDRYLALALPRAPGVESS